MKPKIFVGSSVEGLKIAEGIVRAFKHNAYASVWPQTFPVSKMTIDSLLEEFEAHDFAVFVFSPDDLTTSRLEQYKVTRDNVLFEAGLFMGMHGKDRVFIVTPRGGDVKFHMPSDLSGYTTASYDEDWAKTEPHRAAAEAAMEIKDAIEHSIWSKQAIQIFRKKVTWEENATFQIKLYFSIANHTNESVLIRSLKFDFGQYEASGLTNIYGMRGVGATIHKPEFVIGKMPDGKLDQHRSECYLLPSESCNAWVAFDPGENPANLQRKLQVECEENKLGTWTFTCAWGERRPRTYSEKM